MRLKVAVINSSPRSLLPVPVSVLLFAGNVSVVTSRVRFRRCALRAHADAKTSSADLARKLLFRALRCCTGRARS